MLVSCHKFLYILVDFYREEIREEEESSSVVKTPEVFSDSECSVSFFLLGMGGGWLCSNCHRGLSKVAGAI